MYVLFFSNIAESVQQLKIKSNQPETRVRANIIQSQQSGVRRIKKRLFQIAFLWM